MCTCKPGYVEDGRDCAGTVNRVKNLWNLFEPDNMYFFGSRMPFALTRRVHIIALVTLVTSVMVLIVKVRFTFSMTVNLSRIDLV